MGVCMQACIEVRAVEDKIKKAAFIAINILFCMWHGPIGCVILLCAAIITYFAGLWIAKSVEPDDQTGATAEHNSTPAKYVIPAAGVITVVLMYVYHLTGAYYPIGFSFYMLMAAGYLIDIASGKTEPVKDFPGLFAALGFFPILVSGPIEKLSDLAAQISGTPTSVTPDIRLRGFLLILWGLLEKTSIANILGLIVGEVFDNYAEHTWPAVIIATVCFAFQLYADFDGYSNIARGTATVLGIRVSVNFRQPYLSRSVREFWRRWHISLSTWLKDYIYIPLGGSRHGKVRKYINILITFIVSGLWHGTGLNFIAWGALHGLFQIVEDMTGHKQRNGKGILSIFLTFTAVDFAWFFFRAGSMKDAAEMLALFGHRATGSGLITEFTGCGIEAFHLIYLSAALCLLVASDVMRYRGRDVYGIYFRIPIIIRWIVIYGVIFWILIAWLSLSKVDMSGFIYGSF